VVGEVAQPTLPPQRLEIHLRGISPNEMRSRVLLIWACLALGPVWAEAPLVRVSPPGHTHKLEAATVGANQRTWLGGSTATTGGPDDAFLTLLGPDGATLWEKRFGSPEIGETVLVVAALPDGGALLSGHVNCDLKQAWQGGGATDWTQQTFLARVSEKAELISWVDLRAEPSPEAANEAYEPWLAINCLARSKSGEYLAGGSFTGKYGKLLSREGGRQSTALLLRLSPGLDVLEATPLKGESLDLLHFTGDRVLGAGVGDSQAGDPMGPSSRRAIAWDLTASTTPREIWRGEVRQNTQCLQLDGNHLLISDNESPTTQSVLLASGQVERLPQGIMGRAEWANQSYATGYQNGDVGTELSEIGSVILWHKEADWAPALRWGTTRRDFAPYIFSVAGRLTLVGTTQGNLPDLPPGDGAERWMWVRLDTPPTPEDATGMGVRPLGMTRRELDGDLADLTFLERPGFDHFAGFTMASGRPAAVVTEERPGFDGWSLLRGAGARPGAALEQLAFWTPEKPPFAPMQPQIFPRVSGPIVMCRDFVWHDQHRGTMLTRWSRLGADGGIQSARTLPRDTEVDCQVVLSAENGQSFWLGVEWNAEGQRRMLVASISPAGQLSWSKPYGDWNEFTDLSWIGAERLGNGEFVALGKTDDQLFLQAFRPDGNQTWKIPVGSGRGHAVGVANGQITLATSTSDQRLDLTLQTFSMSGEPLWTRQLPVPAPVLVSKILAAGEETLLLGGWSAGGDWRGFVGTVGSDGQGWQTRQIKVNASHGFDDALWVDGALWVGGEVTRDYETDVFWGRLK
jgi:hypothetical protein